MARLLSCAFVAYPVKPDFYTLHAADRGGLIRRADGIETLAVEVADETTSLADKMMVWSLVRVVAGRSGRGDHTPDEAQALEFAQGAVDGIERYGGYTLSHATVYRLDIGMGVASRDLTRHLQPLVAHPETFGTKSLLEQQHAARDLGGRNCQGDPFHPTWCI